jgi:phosphoribosyl-AMP cyclohydrolase / phosphoribosyl-ATP pyrophosphohydrolase
MKINFEKYADALVPAIVQDAETGRVLMLGFMNPEALAQTRKIRKVTFFSRSRQTLWTKGETSGNFLEVREILLDCDADTILIKAKPSGPVCHTGAATCFNEENFPAKTQRREDDFLFELEEIIRERKENPDNDSYTSKLFAKGLNKIAQKVGEEAIELVIEAKDDDAELFKSEASDLLYHLLVLFAEKNIALRDVLETLRQRRR